jgi:chromosome segregation ATPase
MKVIAEFQGNMQDFKKYIDSLIATTANMRTDDLENEMVNILQKIFDLRLAMEELDKEVQSARKAYEKKLTEYRYAQGELEQLRNYLKTLSQDYAKKVTA